MTAKAPTDPFRLSSKDFEPAYLELYRSGQLHSRARRATERLSACRLCPRNCGADRLHGEVGTCKTARHALVTSAFPHLGEEDCLRGWRGSGTIFFASCNLRCVFCQNFDISQTDAGTAVSPEQLASVMLELQSLQCHNINFVTPSHVVPQILQALVIAVENGLRLPLVYNTSAYETVETLRLLDGVVDIYMPDFKFWTEGPARRYLRAKDYPEVARRALREMHRQVGDLKTDEKGLAKRGVLVRHLVMPDLPEETRSIMRFLAEEISLDTYVNVMPQYRPAGKVSPKKYPELNRCTNRAEFAEGVQLARDAGLWRLDERRGLFGF
jgi:putative pyruvate formate lyase activating enzyme